VKARPQFLKSAWKDLPFQLLSVACGKRQAEMWRHFGTVSAGEGAIRGMQEQRIL
jgi:hypothetical protein